MINKYGATMLEYGFRTNDTDKSIHIKLLNNLFVNEWKIYFKNILKKVNLDWHLVQCANNERYKTDDQVKEYLSGLLSSYNFFNKNNMGDYINEVENIYKLIENPQDITQHNLNIWHRHFTSLEMKYSIKEYQTTTDIDTKLVMTMIQEVNRYAHMLEGATYYKTPRRMMFENNQQYAIQFTNANQANNNNYNKIEVWTELQRLDEGIFDWRCDDYHHTVWINEDILGKDQMKAWLDHDDLREFDITGNLNMTPSIMLDPHRLYEKVLNNSDFRKESLSSGKTIDRLPLGDIVETDIDYQEFLGAKIIYVKLDDEIIWEKNESLL